MEGKFSKTLINSSNSPLSPSNDGDKEGWEAYRRWLAQMSTPGVRTRTEPVSLYTWAGYRDWVAKIRKEWDD